MDNQMFTDAQASVSDYLHSAQGYRRNRRLEALDRLSGYVVAADLSVGIPDTDKLALFQLEELSFWKDAVDRTIADRVGSLRESGASWSQIGAALGISKQAVAQKYGK